MTAPRGLAVFALALATALVLPACSGSGEAGTGRYDTNLITPEQVEQYSANRPGASVYEVIESRRRFWVQRRSALSTASAVSVVTPLGNYIGPADELRGISIQDVRQLEYVEATRAQARFGSNNFPVSEGVIVVTFR